MDEHAPGELLELHIADAVGSWEAAGFDVHDSVVWLDGVGLRLVGVAVDDTGHVDGAERGIRGWALHGVTGDIDGLASVVAPFPGQPSTVVEHPNGVASIDHVVVHTEDFSRTVPTLEAAGLELRRTRTFAFDGAEQQQCFFWLGSTILELVGPAVATEGSAAPATFWGLALTASDLDATASMLGGLATPPKPAVQKGRRISTLKTRDLDISVPVALMSPHVRRDSATDH